ncbi:MAG: hypothetical protein U5K69_26825 [Balneolaceae bacterium]|nr:hypothetical protein [Balneolaceae bacterium]
MGITRPITKHNYLVKDVDKLEQVIREAFHVAHKRTSGTGTGGPSQRYAEH